MQLVGQKAANSVYTSFCLFSCTAMSLPQLLSGVTVMYTNSTGAQVAAIVHAASERGQFVAIKYKPPSYTRQPSQDLAMLLGEICSTTLSGPRTVGLLPQ